MSYRGMMDGWAGDEEIVNCPRECVYYCSCNFKDDYYNEACDEDFDGYDGYDSEV